MKRSAESTYLRRAAFDLIRAAIEPSATIEWTTNDGDAVIELRDRHRIPIRLVPWPHVGDRPTRTEGTVWILARATKRIHDDLRRHQQSFVDVAGIVHLVFPNLLVDRERLPRPRRKAATFRSFDPFADRSSLVVRTLLDFDTGRVWGVRELASEADVAPATVSRVVRELQRFGVIDVRRFGRESRIRLTDPRGLFTLWTQAYDWTKNERVAVHAPIGDPIRFLRRAKGVFEPNDWALTLQIGASLVAPHATFDRVHVYVGVRSGTDLIELAERQGWSIGDDGRLVLMKPYYTESVWHDVREVAGLPVVSTLQLALDLWHYPLRGREQAEHLIDRLRLFR